MKPKEKALDAAQKAINIAIQIDRPSAKGDVQNLEGSGKTKSEIAQQIINGTMWRTGLAGVAAGLPSNPFGAVVAGSGDAAHTLRQHMEMGGRIAYLYDKTFFQTDYPMWELFVPILGTEFVTQSIKKKCAVPLGKHGTKQVIRKYLSKGTLKAFKKLTRKFLGKKILQKTVISKTVPVVGGAISGGWNIAETNVVGNRIVNYFEGKSLS